MGGPAGASTTRVKSCPIRQLDGRAGNFDLITYDDGVARLDLRVSSGTYVRAIADALGGHCRTLRRTEVGPFTVGEADPERVIPVEEALARLPEQVPAE